MPAEMLETHAETAPFVEDYLAALLAQASHLISSAFHEVVAAHDLSIAEWRVLATLAGGRAISIGQLAQIAVSKQSTVTRMLDRMEKKGQVARLAHGSDRRITLVQITAAGTATVGQLIALAREHEERVLAPIGARAASDLKAVLRRLIEANRQPLRGTPALVSPAAAESRDETRGCGDAVAGGGIQRGASRVSTSRAKNAAPSGSASSLKS